MGGRCGVVVRRCGEVRSAVAILIAAGAGPACADRRPAPGDCVFPARGSICEAFWQALPRRGTRAAELLLHHGAGVRCSRVACRSRSSAHGALDVPAATCLDRVGCLGAISPVHLAVPNRTRSRTPPVCPRRRPPICTRTGPETQSRPRSCQAATRPPQVTMTPADAASAPLTDPRKQRSPASGLIPVIDSA